VLLTRLVAGQRATVLQLPVAAEPACETTPEATYEAPAQQPAQNDELMPLPLP
jgi:hypothetical protein